MNTNKRTGFFEVALASTQVGDIELRGRFGGAVCSYYKVAKIENGNAFYEPVAAVSVKNPDGSFSHKYEDNNE